MTRSAMNQNLNSVRLTQPRPRDSVVERRESPRILDTLAAIRRCHRGQEICGQPSPVEYWYRLTAGVARKCALRPHGRRQIVNLLLPDDCFGFTVRYHDCFTVEAVVDNTVVACYPRRRAEELADTDPRVAREIRQMTFDAMTRLQR